MKIKNKKIGLVCISIAIVTISTLFLMFKETNIDRFMNYDESKYRYTRFDTTIYNDDTIMNTMIREYRKIDNKTEKDYLKKVSAKIKTVEDYINYVKEQNELSKDNISLMKKLKNLSKVEYLNPAEADAVIYLIIQDDKLFDKNSWNLYRADLKVYLEDEIIALVDDGTHERDNGGSVIYLKLDDNTLELVNKIIYDAKNQVLDVEELAGKKAIKNLVIAEKNIMIQNNVYSSTDLEARDIGFSMEYARGINIVKEFCRSNSIELTYIEPIEDRISRFEGYSTQPELLEMLKNDGAETINYFTDEDLLNVDLSISIAEIPNKDSEDQLTSHFYSIVYKAAESKIESGFDFRGSKLNEFRNLLVENNEELDFNALNTFINKCIAGEYDPNMRFINTVNDDFIEIIRVENDNLYYRLVYNPIR